MADINILHQLLYEYDDNYYDNVRDKDDYDLRCQAKKGINLHIYLDLIYVAISTNCDDNDIDNLIMTLIVKRAW